MRALLLVLFLAACAPPQVVKSDDAGAAPLSLAGSHWVMMIEDTADGAPTIEFADGARASGFTGCNEWFAQADTRDGGLRFEAIGMTRRACDEAAMALERDFGDLLARTRSAMEQDGVLTLTGEDGNTLARFERAT